MKNQLIKFFNKPQTKTAFYWTIFWILQSVLMSGGSSIEFYLLKNIAIVGLQIVVVYINLKLLFPYFFEKKKYILYSVLSIVLIYLTFSISFFFIDSIFSLFYINSLGSIGVHFSTDFWRILSGSSFYSLALVCSTLYKLLSINKTIEKENLAIKQENLEETICIREGNKSHFVLLNDIYYIKGLREYVVWNTKNKKIISLESLKGIEENLQPKGFLRVHKSYILHAKKIDSITSTSVKIGSEIIPIGRKYKENLTIYIEQNS